MPGIVFFVLMDGVGFLADITPTLLTRRGVETLEVGFTILPPLEVLGVATLWRLFLTSETRLFFLTELTRWPVLTLTGVFTTTGVFTDDCLLKAGEFSVSFARDDDLILPMESFLADDLRLFILTEGSSSSLSNVTLRVSSLAEVSLSNVVFSSLFLPFLPTKKYSFKCGTCFLSVSDYLSILLDFVITQILIK